MIVFWACVFVFLFYTCEKRKITKFDAKITESDRHSKHSTELPVLFFGKQTGVRGSKWIGFWNFSVANARPKCIAKESEALSNGCGPRENDDMPTEDS